MASGVPDSSVPVMSEGAVGAHVSIGALDGDTAGIIIKQQARRIDELERANAELERANAELRGQIAATT